MVVGPPRCSCSHWDNSTLGTALDNPGLANRRAQQRRNAQHLADESDVEAVASNQLYSELFQQSSQLLVLRNSPPLWKCNTQSAAKTQTVLMTASLRKVLCS